MRNSSLKGMLNAASPMKQSTIKGDPVGRTREDFGTKETPKEKTTKPPKKRVNIKTGKHEMHTGTKTNPVTGKKTSQYQAY